MFWILLMVFGLCLPCCGDSMLWAMPRDQEALERLLRRASKPGEKSGRDCSARQGQGELSSRRKRWAFAMQIYFFTWLTYLNQAFKLVSIFNFIRLGHLVFATCSGLLLALSTSVKLAHGNGNPWELLRQATNSVEFGVLTDRYIRISRVDAEVDALPLLLLSIYAFPFVASDKWSALGLEVSFVSSVLCGANAAWAEFDIALEQISPELADVAVGIELAVVRKVAGGLASAAERIFCYAEDETDDIMQHMAQEAEQRRLADV
eukprot:TRINITY_DN26489_c0_g1_i1.p2 TRINITY_DN26489_c0_g1~~TRINITY_DN26489_c0_g1_i1.p2  ORF type:complete len:263 (-),score=47.38 TRINITY_DN26489_c0_g1_i1:52-840(-)